MVNNDFYTLCLLARAQSAREARLAKQDAKRQRLREELERKEKEGVAAKSEEEQARARLKVSKLQATKAHLAPTAIARVLQQGS